MANYQNQYAATTQIVDPGYPISQIDEPPHTTWPMKKQKLKEKIKEKLPGHHKDEPSATTASSSGEEHLREKKGIMDKVKVKLPGLGH